MKIHWSVTERDAQLAGRPIIVEQQHIGKLLATRQKNGRVSLRFAAGSDALHERQQKQAREIWTAWKWYYRLHPEFGVIIKDFHGLVPTVFWFDTTHDLETVIKGIVEP